MLDNEEKPALREEPNDEGPSPDHDESVNALRTMIPSSSSQISYPLSPQSYAIPHAYCHPPDYASPTSPTTPISPSESSNQLGPKRKDSGFTERIVVPTKNEALSSGFPYDPRLYGLMSHDEWHDLSSDIVNAAKLTVAEDWGAWTTGLTTGTISSAFILFGGPVAGYYAGRAVHRKTQVKVVKERLERNGDIRSVLRRHNEQLAQSRGFQAWLELPIDGGEAMNPQDKEQQKEGKTAKTIKSEKKVQQKIARRFKIVIVPVPPMEQNDAMSESPQLGLTEVPLVEAMENE
ncbi:hypothetical protein BJ878DRAFT_427417 [Calycina marina]|uniref:Uncharacterized protein n=1 Tax=Calycina marina TaxID=1763456 RepID=A0A9P7YYJ7_9HELO|nr:hypothetical protein BJ878DRAFT_427417 [Calycina marina]